MANSHQKIAVVEGQDFELPRDLADGLRSAIDRLEETLKPRMRFLSERQRIFRLNNVIGNIQIGSGTIIEVTPKIDVDEDWTTAVISLLTGEERVAVAGERLAGTSTLHRNLLDALANVYLSRLERAIRQDGPLMLMERVTLRAPHLRGKLNVSEWVKKAAWLPHEFPITVTRLAQDNPFTRGMLFVASILGRASSSPRTRARLSAISRDLSPGAQFAPGGSISHVCGRKLPEQWAAYRPAWSIAVAILTRSSLFGTTGNHLGLSLSIEPWPLLETLLHRTLLSIEALGVTSGRTFETRMKGRLQLLERTETAVHRSFSVEPDGRLFEGGQIAATFEAKYKEFDGLPARSDIYQAISTASVCDSELAILVYPANFTPCVWTVRSFNGKPAKLAAIGLDLFSWGGAAGAIERANSLVNFIDDARMALNAPELEIAA